MAATYNGIERSTPDVSPGSELYASKDTYICFLALPQPYSSIVSARTYCYSDEPGSGENPVSSSSYSDSFFLQTA